MRIFIGSGSPADAGQRMDDECAEERTWEEEFPGEVIEAEIEGLVDDEFLQAGAGLFGKRILRLHGRVPRGDEGRKKGDRNGCATE
jgi:hypothetical protein